MSALFKDYTLSNNKRISNIIDEINRLESEYSSITSDKSLVDVNLNGRLVRMTKEKSVFVSKTNEFRKMLNNGTPLEKILPQALALVREAIKRTLGYRAYDVQLEAAIAMVGDIIQTNKDGEDIRQRVIAEMKTGEGKSLVQVLIAYLNVLEATKSEDASKWSSVHIMTSNDALAKRDKEENSKAFDLLGISCGFVPGRRSIKGASLAQRAIYRHNKKVSYSCDVVYATATTIAFDFLDDNTIFNINDRLINRPLGYAIVDEADDLLIDQATNPLKLSTSASADSEFDKMLVQKHMEKLDLYTWATNYLYGFSEFRSEPMTGVIFDQYYSNKDRKFRQSYAYFKDTGEVIINNGVLKALERICPNEEILNLRYLALIDCIKAKEQFKRGVDYELEVDEDKKQARVVLIDQNIGRKKQSSKYTDGIQEAIEAKEEFLENRSTSAKKRYNISFSSLTFIKAMCTYPDFLGLYSHNVCGMTGTSDEEEFQNLYGFETYRVKTRKRSIRVDEEDELYPTLSSKYEAIIEEVIKAHRVGQPVLIGTTSLNESLIISSLLKRHGIIHNVLNANNEELESQIIAGAGLFGSVTVSTNMAGRGTDIKLGPGVREVGGLYVIGTSKNKSKRIDLQLRGRSGRQGDIGKTKYFSSLEDDLVREQYQNGALSGVIEMFRENPKRIKNKKLIKCESRCQELRESKDKQTRLDTEKLNKAFQEHRKIIYDNRNKVLESNELEFMSIIKTIMKKYIDTLVDNNDLANIRIFLGHLIDVDRCYSSNKSVFKQNLINLLFNNFKNLFNTPNRNEVINRYVKDMKIKFLKIIDSYWIEHINVLENLKSSILIFSSDDPFKEFEMKSNQMFSMELIPAIYNEMITYALHPSLSYGQYQINYNTDSEEEQKHR